MATPASTLSDKVAAGAITAALLAGAFWYFSGGGTAAKTPPAPAYADIAETRLLGLYRLRIAASTTCAKADLDGAWYVGCSYGASRGIYQAMPDPGPRGFAVIAMNGKAMQHLASGDLGDTVPVDHDPAHSLDSVIAALDAAR